ncbi:MAG: decaprenyl-phosphate phosphoribosyltransferase, partial [Chloroflexi bacterium]|nr:decaprenyl-phosphate phosphoribosyltransferase [Chloroflexota bacterium]
MTRGEAVDRWAIVRLMRPKQWAKNVLVAAAPGAAGRLDEPAVMWTTAIAFASFCLASSAMYAANDARDAGADR